MPSFAKTIPDGFPKVAEVVGPLETPYLPEPAKIVVIPDGVIFQIRLFL